MKLDYEDKRSSPRIKLKVPVHFQIRGKPESDNSLTENISTGGLGFIADKYIPPSTNLMLELKILSQVINPIAKVSWISPESHSNRYHLGVQFLELEPQKKEYLQQYIDMQQGAF